MNESVSGAGPEARCGDTQGNDTFLFYSVSRAPCWTKGEGGQMWSPGGDIYMQTSSDSGAAWSKPQVRRCSRVG